MKQKQRELLFCMNVRMGCPGFVFCMSNMFILAMGTEFLPRIVRKEISNLLSQTYNTGNFTQWKKFIERIIIHLWILKIKNMTSYLHYILSHYHGKKFKEMPNYCNRKLNYGIEMSIFGKLCGTSKIAKSEPPHMTFCQLWKEGKYKQLCDIWKGRFSSHSLNHGCT